MEKIKFSLMLVYKVLKNLLLDDSKVMVYCERQGAGFYPTSCYEKEFKTLLSALMYCHKVNSKNKEYRVLVYDIGWFGTAAHDKLFDIRQSLWLSVQAGELDQLAATKRYAKAKEAFA